MLIELLLILVIGLTLIFPIDFCIKALKLVQTQNKVSTECQKTSVVNRCKDRLIIDERGNALVIFMIQLSVATIVLSMLSTQLGSSFKASALVTKELREQEKLYHVAGLLKLTARELDYHRLPIRPAIFKEQVYFNDGSQLNLSKKGDAISSLTFYGETALVIQEKHDNVFFGCFKEKPPKPTRLLIGISTDGMALYKAQNEIGGKQCESFEISLIPSLTLPASDLRKDTLRIFYPVSREYLIYLSTNNELRYMQFEGNRVVEHQPLEADIFNLSLDVREVSKLYLLDATIESKNRTLNLPLFHALTRVDPFVFLYNL